MKTSGTSRLGLYVAGLVCVGLLLEGACRHWERLFRAVGHRSLFKAALLEQRLPQDIVVFGTSRGGEAIRPGPFLSELKADGAPPLTVFNASTPYSSLEILQAVTGQFAASPGLKLAIIEISRQQLFRAPVPWGGEKVSPQSDFDSQTIAWLEAHSALVADRKVFVLNSLSRLGLVAFAGRMFDGTEEFGTDYMAALVGISHDVPPARFAHVDCMPRAPEPAPDPLTSWVEERDMYLAMAKDFAAHGVQVAFFVPPYGDAEHSVEALPDQRALRASLHALSGRPVWDFSGCQLPGDYFRDVLHLSHLGGSHFSHFVGRAAASDASIAAALGIAHTKPEANAVP